MARIDFISASGSRLHRALFENPQFLKREPDNASIRAALAAGTVLEGAELRRGHHIRLT
jgi:hypothetical protein